MKKVLIIVAALLLFGKALYVYITQSSKIVTIKSIDHKVYKNGDDEEDKYLIFTEDAGVFENTDSWFYLKWNSSDVQNKLIAGKKFKIKYYGWRMPFLSGYPNVVSAEKID